MPRLGAFICAVGLSFSSYSASLWIEKMHIREAGSIAELELSLSVQNAGKNIAKKYEEGIRTAEYLLSLQSGLNLSIPVECQQQLSDLWRRLDEYQGIAFFDESGRLACTNMASLQPALIGGTEDHQIRSAHVAASQFSEESACGNLLFFCRADAHGNKVILVPSGLWFHEAIDLSRLPSGSVWFLTDQSGQLLRRASMPLRYEVPQPDVLRQFIRNKTVDRYQVTSSDGMLRRYMATSVALGSSYNLFIAMPEAIVQSDYAVKSRSFHFIMLFWAVLYLCWIWRRTFFTRFHIA